MTRELRSSFPQFVDHLRSGEEVLWFQSGGHLPLESKVGYLVGIGIVTIWGALAVNESFATAEPLQDLPVYFKFFIGAIFLGWAVFLLLVTRNHLLGRNTFIFAITSNRLLVSNSRWLNAVHSVCFDEVGSVSTKGSEENGSLKITRRQIVSFNPFWRYSDWRRVRHPHSVKEVIDQRLNEFAQRIDTRDGQA